LEYEVFLAELKSFLSRICPWADPGETGSVAFWRRAPYEARVAPDPGGDSAKAVLSLGQYGVQDRTRSIPLRDKQVLKHTADAIWKHLSGT
jgi:hypothetical protein